MTTRGVSVLAVWLLAFLVLGGGAPAVGAPQGQPEAFMQAEFLQVPLTFEVNRGQTAAQVKYLSRGLGRTLFLTPSEAVLVLQRDQQARRDPGTPAQPTVLRLRLVGANPAPRVEGLELLPGKANYFIGNDPTKWRANIPTYTKVKYQSVYPGVDLVYYGTNQRQLEYDFVVAPGAKPKAIRLAFTGMDRLTLDAQGNLILHTAGGEVLQYAPKVYQEINGARRAIAGRYVLYGKDQVGFRVAGYDRTKPLVIDPTLSVVYSTYLGGGADDEGLAIAVDGSGNTYVTGVTVSTNFPMAANTYGGSNDAFVAKLGPAGSALVYSTYLGGSGFDQGSGIAVDGSGNAYVTGFTQSAGFPTTAGAFQTAYGGSSDAFVTKLGPTGTLSYSTYLGGTRQDQGAAIAVDGSGNAYVTGRTKSPFTDFTGAHFVGFNVGNGSSQDGFVAKLDPSGSALVYFTYVGGGGSDEGLAIAVDGSGNAYVTGDASSSSADFPATALGLTGGTDTFVVKLDPTGIIPLYVARLGGTGLDLGAAIAVDGSGNAYVTGLTTSSNFPTTPLTAFQAAYGGGLSDAFVVKLDPAGSALVYSTYLGGTGFDFGSGIALDSSGHTFVAGLALSSDFPQVNKLTSCGPGVNAGVSGDAFVAMLDSTMSGSASLLYSSFLGGSGSESNVGMAADSSGNVYVAGTTGSTNFPVTGGVFQPNFGGVNDAYVTKLGVVTTFCVTTNTAGTGTGTVTSSPAAITCPGTGTCSATYTSPTSVTLTATPTGPSTFGGWSGGGCSGSGTCTVSSAATVTAAFNPSLSSFTVTVSLAGTGTGSVTSNPPGLACTSGSCNQSFTTPVTLTATPTVGSTFAGWSGGGCSGSGTCSVSSTQSVTATFSSGGGPGGGEPGCNMVGHVHGNQNYKATISGKKVNVHVEVDGDCDYDKKANKIFLHHSKVHVVVDGGPPLINAKQNSNGKRDDVKSVTLSPGPPPATGTPTAVVEGIYDAIPFKVTLTDGGKHREDDTVVVMMPVLPAPITGSAPHDNVHINFE